jgi:hypothetical protein
LAITDYLSDHQLTSSADDLIDQLIIPFFLQPWCSTLVDETGHHGGQLMTLLIS